MHCMLWIESYSQACTLSSRISVISTPFHNRFIIRLNFTKTWLDDMVTTGNTHSWGSCGQQTDTQNQKMCSSRNLLFPCSDAEPKTDLKNKKGGSNGSSYTRIKLHCATGRYALLHSAAGLWR